MNRTIVAVFESSEDAEAARDELISAGIPAEDVHFRGGASTGGRTAADEDRAGFWRGVLGSTDAADGSYGYYAEAERRGNAALVVEDVEEREAATIETALAAHGVLDIDNLAEDWRSRGWSRYDERAPALSPGELEEERRAAARSRPGADRLRCVRVYSIVVTQSQPAASAKNRASSGPRAK